MEIRINKEIKDYHESLFFESSRKADREIKQMRKRTGIYEKGKFLLQEKRYRKRL